MARFAQHYPHTELRCGPAEDADVIEMIQQGLAHVGILATQPSYPADVAVARLPEQAEFGVYVASGHPLASLAQVQAQHLENARQLYIKTYAPSLHHGRGQAWSAPDYLTLLEFAVRGFGWAELPRALVARFGNELVELQIAGYPRRWIWMWPGRAGVPWGRRGNGWCDRCWGNSCARTLNLKCAQTQQPVHPATSLPSPCPLACHHAPPRCGTHPKAQEQTLVTYETVDPITLAVVRVRWKQRNAK
jgi:hypothetical protein